MASAQSSAQSSSTISQLIDQIINTKQDSPGFDLDELIANIDNFLALCKANKDKSSRGEKATADWLSSTSDAANISEAVSENVNILAKEISEYAGKEHSTAISVLRAAGNVHWAGLCLLLVAAVLKRMDTINKNKMETLDLLNSMNNLAKVVRKLKEIPRAKDEMLTQINESIGLIVQGAIVCCSQKKIKGVKRFWNASKARDELIALRSKVEETYTNLNLQISVRSLSIQENTLICNQPSIHSVEHAVGIDKQIDEVVKRLQWENDTPSIAVVVHGIGGSGKTTLADAVYHSLRDNLKGWKYSKITLPQYLKEYRNVEDLQSFILEDLTGKREQVRDSQSGRQRLKEVMEKESVFLYIDNALFPKRLQELLPREITNPTKLRLLLTARKTSTLSDVMHDCGVKCDIYSIEPLPLDAAIQLLLRSKISPEKNTSSLSGERPELEMIAKKCRSCPLFLEVVGGFLRRRRNADDCYERVLQWMENGEPFSGDKEDRFDEERIMFAFDQLEQNAQEAFLDICSFYGCDSDWDEVACIVGKVEMECLEEGALIKRKNEISKEGKMITKISIHDLLLSVGCNKSRNNRFSTPEEFMKAMQNDQPLHQIKGVWLTYERYVSRGIKEWTYKSSEFKGPINVAAEALDAMSGSLRVFAMGNWTFVKGKCTQRFDQLRFVQANERSSLPMDISNLPRLTSIDCSFKGNIKLNEGKDLSALKVVVVSCPPDSWNFNEMCEGIYPSKLCNLALHGYRGTGISNFVKLSRLRRLRLSLCWNLMELPESLGRLSLLEELYLNDCGRLKWLPVGFGKLKALVVLNLYGCRSLQELPKDFVSLSSLQYLNFSKCSSLQELPKNFEKLDSLQYLNLKGCSDLIRLPERLGNMPCLTQIYFSECKKLCSLPQSLGGMTSLSKTKMLGCSSLTELPEETSWLSGMTSIYFDRCSSLKRLPTEFSTLTCLQELDLRGCRSIQELCSDFHRLEVLKELKLGSCRRLSTLPRGFGKLKSLKTLDLSACDKLEELCIDFHCLGALKKLSLSECFSLKKLPEYFGQLVCLENADLSGCSNLAKLSNDFHTLPSLMRINLSNCKRLGAECMDVVGATQSLLYADISGNEGMIQRWNEMQREREQWDLLVVTDSFSKDIKGTPWPLFLEKVTWRIFSKAGLLIDDLQRHYCSSSLPSCVRLILITESYSANAEKWGMVERNLERLQCNSKEWAIIYIGTQLDALPSLLADRTVAHSPFDSFLYYFRDVLPRSFYCGFPGVFTASITITLERNTVKYLSTWEDISYISDEIEFISRNPSGSNLELLKKLCETQETDFLLHNDKQVKVKDLEGKVVLLLRQMRNSQTSALEDVYLELQRRSDCPVEVVFISCLRESDDPEEYERAVTNAPWPIVPKPWLINKRYWRLLYGLLVVDEKGSISHKDAMPMILRWGVKAYPFSTNREAELRESEWKEFNLSTQSSLEFVLQNMEFFQPRETEAVIRGEMVFLCVGPIQNMLEFLPQLTDALRRLANVIHVFYIADTYLDPAEEEEYETKRREMCSITSLSFYDAQKCWKRINYLWHELSSQGVSDRIVQVRSIALALHSPMKKWYGISIIAVDEKGEMISGRCEEIVEQLCHSDSDQEEEKRMMMMREIESEGLSNVLRKRWTIHHRAHPHHPLVRIDGRMVSVERCDKCFQDRYFPDIRYRCSVCENYTMCQECFM